MRQHETGRRLYSTFSVAPWCAPWGLNGLGSTARWRPVHHRACVLAANNNNNINQKKKSDMLDLSSSCLQTLWLGCCRVAVTHDKHSVCVFAWWHAVIDECEREKGFWEAVIAGEAGVGERSGGKSNKWRKRRHRWHKCVWVSPGTSSLPQNTSCAGSHGWPSCESPASCRKYEWSVFIWASVLFWEVCLRINLFVYSVWFHIIHITQVAIRYTHDT